MANFAKIVATYSDLSGIDSTFKIRFVNTSRSIDLTFTWICKSLRVAAFQVTQGSDANSQGFNALDAVATDINNSSLVSYMIVGTASNAFQVEAAEYGWTVEEVTGSGTPNVTFVETPEVVPLKNFELTSFSIAEAAAPCADIQVTIEENDGVAPYSWITPVNSSTTLVADVTRGAIDQLITVTLEDSELDQASINNVTIPRIFTSSEIADIGVDAGPLDATVTVLMATQDFGTYLYSIDGVNFQVSNIFTNVEEGSYTLSVNDGYGCVVTKAFTVTLPTAENYFRVPKLNTIEFKVPDDKRQNFNNTLFVDMLLPFRAQKNKYCQVYFDDEICSVQFQSNFDSHTVKVINYNTGAEIATIVPVMVYDSPEGFKYYEFTVNFTLYSDLVIQIQIIPTGETLGGGLAAKSEPLDVRTEDLENEFVKIQYQSNVNCSDIYWISGFNPYLYVLGQVADTLPQINKEVARDCNWNQNTQSRELIRQIQLFVSKQPAYIFEKLQWALGNGQGKGNYYLVNDMSVNGEAGAFEDPSFTDKYSLGDSQAKLEQKDLFTGDLSLTPTPPVTVNYLLVNPSNEGGLLVGPDDEYTLV